jgi:hypothetical protein
MYKFILKVSIFSCILILAILGLFSFANGYTDPFYLRFTTPKQNGLILGTSRAAQDIQPTIINKLLGKQVYNYAFTVAHSPYGPAYLKSVKKKLNKNTKNGVFILTVDPWSICSWTDDPNDSLSFRELNRCVGNTCFVNLKPNPFYLLNNYQDKYINLLTKSDLNVFLHDDGWLEITIDMDSTKTRERIVAAEKSYRDDYLVHAKFSELRLGYLKKTIKFLNEHGHVYLVRLPIHPKIMEIENELMPDFNFKIKEAVGISLGYLDLTDRNNTYLYTDGNHLYKESGEKISRILGNWILEQER